MLTLGVAALGGLLGLGLQRWLTRPATTDAPLPNIGPAVLQQLYSLQLPDSKGASQALAQWRGQVLVVNFWATWCPPCIQEMPMFNRLASRYAPRGVQFVGLALDRPEAVASFARRQQITYPLLIASDGATNLMFDLGNAAQGLPFSVILDRGGRLHHVKLGAYREAELVRELDRLVSTHADTQP